MKTFVSLALLTSGLLLAASEVNAQQLPVSDQVQFLPPGGPAITFTFAEGATEQQLNFFTRDVNQTPFLIGSVNPATTTGTIVAQLIEGMNLLNDPVSDQLIMRISAAPAAGQFHLSFDFLSDIAEGTALTRMTSNPGNFLFVTNIAETGGPQFVTTTFFGNPPPAPPFTVAVQSDLNPIPQPSALTLVLIGAISMVGVSWLRSTKRVRR
jgi:hypothetical protein